MKFKYNYFINQIIKLLIILIEFLVLLKYNKVIKISYFDIKKKCFDLYLDLNLKFSSLIKSKIKIGTYAYDLKNGGRARLTTMLLNYLYRIKIFDIYLLTNSKGEGEYAINENIKRVSIKQYNLYDIIKKAKKKN